MTSDSLNLPASIISGVTLKSVVLPIDEVHEIWFRSGFYAAADFISSPQIRIPLQELLNTDDSIPGLHSQIDSKDDDDRGGAFQKLPPNTLITNRIMEIYIPYTNPQSPPETDLLSIAICLTIYRNSYLISFNQELSDKVRAAALLGFHAAVQDLARDAELILSQPL